MVNFFRILDSDRHVLFCPMNFVADTYMGCPHACWYCYAPSFAQRFKKYEAGFQGFRNFKRRFKRDKDFEKIEVAIKGGKVKGTCSTKQENFVAKAIKNKHPLRIGSVSEPFGIPLEKQYEDTYRILEILVAHDYPFVVCTKSPLVATQRYVNLLKSTKKRAVQISLISLDENLLGYLESRPDGTTPSAKSRLDALRKLSNEDIFTTCRIQPMIPQATEYGMKDLIFALAETGVKHVIVEFLWFPSGHAKDMSVRLKLALNAYSKHGGIVGNALKEYNNDLYSFYQSFEDHFKGYGRVFFSRKQMAQLMPKFAQMVSEANEEFNTEMTFGSGNEETTYLNFTNNCCGIDRISGFSQGSPCTIHTMMKIAKEKGKVTLDDMKSLYNPRVDKIEKLWNKKEKRGYFIENMVFKIRAKTADNQVEYVYDKSAVPGSAIASELFESE